jgi:chitinase
MAKIGPSVNLVIAFLLTAAALTLPARAATLPARIIVGYWHNFANAAGTLKLSDVPRAYDVVDVAFADAQSGATFTFTPLSTLYSTNSQFINDINILHSRGQKVLISIGGANAVIQLTSATDIQNFVSSLSSIIRDFGFDGIDLDLEGASLILDSKDTDFRSPTTPAIVNLITAVNQLLDQFPGGLILSAAPETAYVQGGYGTYAGIYGAYLPVIHALRDRLTYIHVQDYNTGSMYGRDGYIYDPGSPDFLVAMADMLIAGFTVDAYRAKIPFPGLGADKVLIGIPATADAAGSGYMPFSQVRSALNYLYAGRYFGGGYQLSSPTGYAHFRGVMTWSINWDVHAGLAWSDDYRKYLDTLVTPVSSAPIEVTLTPGQLSLDQNYPNPFNPTTTIQYVVGGVVAPGGALLGGGEGPVLDNVRLAVYDVLGRLVAVLVDGGQTAGLHEIRFDGSKLTSGVYFYRLTVGSHRLTRSMVLLR